jgi:hypothetical protein
MCSWRSGAPSDNKTGDNETGDDVHHCHPNHQQSPDGNPLLTSYLCASSNRFRQPARG